MKDVAHAAGVSTATVSFVLNQTPHQSLRATTIDRVQRAAESLGYTPNRIARALREGSSRLVVLRARRLRGRSLDTMISGLEQELSEDGYTLLVTDSETGVDDLLAAVAPRQVLDFQDPQLPGVYDGWLDEMSHHTATQLSFLLDRGHRHIAYATPATGMLVDVRMSHVKQYLSKVGAPDPVPFMVPRNQAELPAAIETLRRDNPAVTAIAAYDDRRAIRLLAGLNTLRVQVPGDLAVIGFDADDIGAWWNPALTTVEIDSFEYGRRIGRAVLGLPDLPWPHQPSRVLVRDTV